MDTKTMEPSTILPGVAQVTNYDPCAERVARRKANGWSIGETADAMTQALGKVVSYKWPADYEAGRLKKPRAKRVAAYEAAISRHRKQPFWKAIWRHWFGD